MRLGVPSVLESLTTAVSAGSASASISNDAAVGLINDQSKIYADLNRQGWFTAARMTSEFGWTRAGPGSAVHLCHRRRQHWLKAMQGLGLSPRLARTMATSALARRNGFQNHASACRPGAQSAFCSAVRHCQRVIEAVGTDEAGAVAAECVRTP